MVDRFPVVLRGYDKEKVDAAFDATQESMKRAQQTLASMREQIAADDDRILQLQAQLQEEKNKKPEGNSFASLGANAQQMLASAEQTSTELLERAKQDASSIRTTAQAQAETLINNAKLDAQHIVDDANAKAASILTNASNQAESVTTSANEDAAQLRSETAKTITEQRQTVELELSNAREEHTKKMASERSTQEREIADMKAEATQQVAAMRKSANEEITKLKSDSNDQIEAALAEANKKLADVREVYSHGQAIAQCAGFIESHDQHATKYPNTAMSAEMVASSGRTDVAAIASRSCATLYGLEVLESNIQDSDNNYTRFVVISREPRVYPGANRTSLMITTANEPGALYRVLERFYALNINLIKLESRPIPGRDFEFMFYFDLDCPFGSKALDDLLDSIDDVCESFTYFGSYTEVL